MGPMIQDRLLPRTQGEMSRLSTSPINTPATAGASEIHPVSRPMTRPAEWTVETGSTDPDADCQTDWQQAALNAADRAMLGYTE